MPDQNPTIMVVEDETLLLQAITKKLKLSNLDVVSCASGEQALDYLDSLDELPQAVWLDYYLKDMNGLAFMQKLKDVPKWADIPVVVVSNSASPEKVHNMLALGAKKYILKAEFRLDEIISMIRELIQDSKDIEAEQKVKDAAAGSLPAPLPSPTPAAPSETPPAPDVSAIFPPQPPTPSEGA